MNKFFKVNNEKYLQVEVDEYPENPRTFYEGIGNFYTFMRDKISPDEHSYRDVDAMLDDLLGEGTSEIAHENEFSIQDILKEFENKGYIALAIYCYEHGNVNYQLAESNPFSCPWDSSVVGFAFVSEETLRTEGIAKENAVACMKAEMADYTAWANGEVYLVTSYDSFGEIVEENMTYYGFDGIRDEFKEMEELEEIESENSLVDYLIQEHPEKFARSDNPKHQMQAAQCSGLSSELLEELSNNDSAMVRANVASNKNTSKETLEKLEKDISRGVKGRAMIELDRRENSSRNYEEQER